MSGPSPKRIHKFLSPGPGQLGWIITQIHQLQQLASIINDLLPPPLDRHCRVAAVNGQTVILHADSAAWATRARYQCNAIAAAMRGRPGCHSLRDVRVKVRPRNSADAARPDAGPLPMLTAAGAETLKRAAAGLEVASLREALLRVASRAPKK